MLNLHLAPFLLEVFSHKAAMAMVGLIFAAEEASSVQQ
jgi:hypothetical protein